jgi:hypothetical protein
MGAANMHIALVLTQESILSTVACAYDLMEYCRHSTLDKGASSVFAVTSDAGKRFGFMQ